MPQNNFKQQYWLKTDQIDPEKFVDINQAPSINPNIIIFFFSKKEVVVIMNGIKKILTQDLFIIVTGYK